MWVLQKGHTMHSALKFTAGSLAAFTLFAASAPAGAADLGGNCCADLEERIAELEVTTARKGNRKVSLTISGWVNEAVYFWDDGTERNVYVGNNALEQSRIRFLGEAKINADLSAGYLIELGLQDVASNAWDQAKDSATSSVGPMQVRSSNWFFKSKAYGKLAVGLQGTATYHLIDDAVVANTRYFSDFEAAAVTQGSFFLKSGGANVNNLRWKDILGPSVNNGSPGQNGRRNVIRYDSPDIAGFTFTASWGEDDMGGVALTYKNVWGDFKVIGKVGWEQSSDENTNPCSVTLGKTDCEWYGGAASIMHVPTGLYVFGGYAQTVDHQVQAGNPAADDTDTSWYLQGGIERKWIPLGATTIFGEYRHDDTGSRLSSTFGGSAIRDGNVNFWAAGAVQSIDAAAMDLYLIYRHADGDINNFAGANAELDAFDTVITGALIKF